MNIGFFEVSEKERQFLSERLKEHELFFSSRPLTAINAYQAERCELVSTFIYSHIDSQVLESIPNLKMVQTRSAGFDHIDVASCMTKGIQVAHVPQYGERSVAEHAFALLLSLVRKIHSLDARVRDGNFAYRDLMGFELHGKTLGVIGAGRIGRAVMEIARGFDMRVLVYDPFVQVNESTGSVMVPLKTLIAESDIITLHAPAMQENHHLLNTENLQFVKPGVIIVNTARGSLIESEALYRYLEDGSIGGVALDVFEGEYEAVTGHYSIVDKLQKFDNVLITPHVAYYTKESMIRILSTTVETIEAYKKGEIINKVPYAPLVKMAPQTR